MKDYEQRRNSRQSKAELCDERNLCSEGEQCLKLLELILDGEASPEQESLFFDHINKCAHCFDVYHVESQLKEFIRLKVSNKRVPTDLLALIRHRIFENI